MRRTAGTSRPSGLPGPGCTAPRDHARSRPAHRARDYRLRGPGRPLAGCSAPARRVPRCRDHRRQVPSGPERPGRRRHQSANRARHRRPAGLAGQPPQSGGPPPGHRVAGSYGPYPPFERSPRAPVPRTAEATDPVLVAILPQWSRPSGIHVCSMFARMSRYQAV